MRVLWDEPKRKANLAKRGMDFAALDEEFFGESAVYPVKRNRWIAIGTLEDGRIAAVIFVPLGREAISVISMRPASLKERKPR